jgi:hypothetical protein
MTLFVAFFGSVALIAAGGLLLFSARVRPAGAALVGLGTLLLILAVISAANFNS